MGHYRYRVKYMTDESVSEVERILRSRCRGDWSLEEKSAPGRFDRRSFLVSFEQETDIGALLSMASGGY